MAAAIVPEGVAGAAVCPEHTRLSSNCKLGMFLLYLEYIGLLVIRMKGAGELLHLYSALGPPIILHGAGAVAW